MIYRRTNNNARQPKVCSLISHNVKYLIMNCNKKYVHASATPPTNDLPQVKVPEWLEPPFGDQELKTVTHLVPVKDIRQVFLRPLDSCFRAISPNILKFYTNVTLLYIMLGTRLLSPPTSQSSNPKLYSVVHSITYLSIAIFVRT